MAREKVTNGEAGSTKAAVRSRTKLTRLQKECNLSRRRTATVERSVTVLHKELGEIAAEACAWSSEMTRCKRS